MAISAYVQNDPVSFVDPSGLDITLPGIPFLGPPIGPPPSTVTVNIPSDASSISMGHSFFEGMAAIEISAGGEFENPGGGVGGFNSIVTPTPNRQGDPNSKKCQDLARKIANIQNDLYSHASALIHNPNSLQEVAPTGKIADGVTEHRDRLLREAENLQERIQQYRDECGGGNPPSVPTPHPVRSYRDRSTNYPVPGRDLARYGIGVSAMGILCGIFFEVCVPVVIGGGAAGAFAH